MLSLFTKSHIISNIFEEIPLRIYLSVPVTANRDLNIAILAANTIKNMGHTIVSEWVLSPDPGYNLVPNAVFNRDMKGITDADILVAEISMASHGVGMEIILAHIKGKKIICLFKKGYPISRMLQGTPGLRLIEYATDSEFVAKLRESVAKPTALG